MATARIVDVGRFVDQDVEVSGWLQARRSSGRLHFLIVRDGSGSIQGIVSARDVDPGLFALAGRIGQESSLRISGHVRADSRAPGGFEMTVSGLTVIHEAHEYPITPKDHGVDFLMSNRHLWLRSSRQQAIMRIRARIIGAIRGFLDSEGFTVIDSPILTGNAAEGTTTLFSTQYFDQTAYLSQSGQLYVEAAAMALGRVYCFGPTFRAEKSKTRRHLTEFWMVEPEMAFFDLDDSMALQERLITHIVATVLDRNGDDLAVLERDTTALERVTPPFPRITYDDAIEKLRALGEEITWGDDFGGGHETVIASEFDRPLFVHRYPSSIKAFYMKADPARPELALCADLLAPEGYGEIIGGSQRIDDLALLEHRIDEHGLSREQFDWYLDLRRYGSVPHSGFGLGIERTVAWICGLHHLRETIPFARTLDRLYP
ncbi:MAG: asparagine--tRNA ligase [Chloroflexota bacterium]|nr:MAG: asparagine--tRNA ligase [Chloroflexota bacterium]